MLVQKTEVPWYFMEIPRTATTTIDRYLRARFPAAFATYRKHWPILPEPSLFEGSEYAHIPPLSIISVRNPYARAVSCWRLIRPEVSFLTWVERRLSQGFYNEHIEARPQSFWLQLQPRWDFVLRSEPVTLETDMFQLLWILQPKTPAQELPHFNRSPESVKKPWPQVYLDQPEAAWAVQELYREDFRALRAYGYQFRELQGDDVFVEAALHPLQPLPRYEDNDVLRHLDRRLMDPKTAANATAWWNRFGSRYPQDWIAGKVIADSALAKDIV